MGVTVEIPMKNGAKISISGDTDYVKQTLPQVDELVDALKTAIGEVEPVTMGQELQPSLVTLQPQDNTQIPAITKSNDFTDTLLGLMGTPWGKQPRTLPEIEEALRTNGEYRAKSTVATALLRLVKQGKLRRIRDSAKSLWKYVST